MRFFKTLVAFLILFFLLASVAYADDKAAAEAPAPDVADRFAEAQGKLLSAKGVYKTIRMQEEAIKNMRKATKLSLNAAKLRAKAEKMQTKADLLVNKANLSALSRGLYITNPLAPVMAQPPPQIVSKPTTTPITPPVPGEPIGVTIPIDEEVSFKPQQQPVLNNY